MEDSLKSKSPAPDGQRLIEQHDKDNHFSLKLKILSVLSVEKCTAIQMNGRFCTSDARKYISILRSDGYPISDYRLPDRRKVYFIHKRMEDTI